MVQHSTPPLPHSGPVGSSALLIGPESSLAAELRSLLSKSKFVPLRVPTGPDSRVALRDACPTLVILLQPFDEAGWLPSLRIAKRLAPAARVWAVSEAPTEIEIRNAVCAGSYTVFQRPIPHETFDGLARAGLDGLFIVLHRPL